MTEYWVRSRVYGSRHEEGTDAAGDFRREEDVLHRRGEDPIRIACRRNLELARCSCFRVETDEAFLEIRGDAERRKERSEIKADGAGGEEWDW